MRFRRAVVFGALLFGATFALGCPSKPAQDPIVSQPMPQGEMWSGVYYHPVFGHLHLEEKDGAVVGRWRTATRSGWGELNGSSSGNVLKYSFVEHKYGMVGPSATVKGTGYFLYRMGANGFPELKGKFGMGSLDPTTDWDCLKQVNQKPDIDSIKGELGPGEVPLISEPMK